MKRNIILFLSYCKTSQSSLNVLHFSFAFPIKNMQRISGFGRFVQKSLLVLCRTRRKASFKWLWPRVFRISIRKSVQFYFFALLFQLISDFLFGQVKVKVIVTFSSSPGRM